MKGIEDFYPLSPAQLGVLFHILYSPNTRVYFQQFIFSLDGDLDIPNFMRAWDEVLKRHPALRCSFMWEGLREPIQVVHERAPLPFEQHDWRDLTATEQRDRLQILLRADRELGFVLSRAPLIRLTLIRVCPEIYRFILSCHHILIDGWSAAVISREVMTFYEAFRHGQPIQLDPPASYRSYVAWLRRQRLSEAEAFWRRKLKNFTTASSLVAELRNDDLADQEEGYSEHSVRLSTEATAALQALGRRRRMTLNTLVQGAWALLLNRYSGQQDVVFGVVVSGRPSDLPGVESIVGLFVNILPVRVIVRPEESLKDWLQRLQEEQIAIQKYEHCPLAEIQRWSEIPRGMPIFESIFAFENYPVDTAPREQEKSLKTSVVGAFERTNYPITVMVGLDLSLALRILYDSRQVNPAVAMRMLQHYRTLLENIVPSFDQSVSALSMITDAESNELIGAFNASLEA